MIAINAPLSDWFSHLCEENRTLVDGLKKKGWDKGLRRLAVDKYPDPVHFVYELLQNAEDQDATRVQFLLRKDRLLFRHNGKSFSPRDVEGITGLGDSDKPLSEEVKIGRFGIGFKSVFVVTERPEIYSTLNGTPFSFAIEDIFVPTPQTDTRGYCREGETCFVLPFKEADREVIHEKIRTKLQSLGADTLLFLNDITEIDWETDAEAGTYLCERAQNANGDDGTRYTLLGEAGTRGGLKRREEMEYLVFARSVQIRGAEANRPLKVQIAFRLHNGGVVPEPGQSFVNVYFPTEEKSDLKFRLHAPFLLTDNRANIKRGEKLNESLMEIAASLLVVSLSRLKKQGLLNTACLGVLPLRVPPPTSYSWLTSHVAQDAGIFEPFFAKTREALSNEALLPTDNGTYVRAEEALIPRSTAIRNLLTEAQLTELFAKGTPPTQRFWLSSDITEDRTPELRRFLLSLDISEVDPEAFATKVTGSFLTTQTDEWMVRFYTFLGDLEMLWGKGRNRPILRSRPILRLESGEHIVPFKDDGATPRAYLPPPGRETLLPIVKRVIAVVPECLTFFTRLGLTLPDAVGDVIEFLLPTFEEFSAQGNARHIDETEYSARLREIASAIRQCPQAKWESFLNHLAETPFVLVQNAANANQLAFATLGEACEETPDLRLWYDGNPEAWFLAPALTEHTDWPGIAAALALKGVSPIKSMVVHHRAATYGGAVSLRWWHGDHARGLDGFDPEASINGLDHVLATITVEKARLLWSLLLTVPKLIRGHVETATRQDFSNGRTEGPKFSTLGRQCVEAAWIPDGQGAFHQPEALALFDLPNEAGFDRESALAKALAQQLGMNQAEALEVAERLGVDASDLSDFLSMTEEEREQWREFRANRRQQEIADAPLPTPKPTFPSSASRNPARRAQKMREYAQEAGDKVYGKVERSVRLSVGLVAEDADSYLRRLYENEDGVMVCQICQDAMPFRRDDEEWYFERVQCVREITGKELYPNYLALCPVCAAKYKVVNHTEPAEIAESLLTHPGLHEHEDGTVTPIEVEVVLCGVSQNIRFVADHLYDLQAILSEEAVFVGSSMTARD